MAKAFRIGHPLDTRQNRLEILDEDDDVSCAIEDIEMDEDDKDDVPMILLEDDDEGDGVALSQRDLQELWVYLEAFRKNGTIGMPKVDLDRADHISSSQQDGSPYIHIRVGSTQYDVLIDETAIPCSDVVAKALQHAADLKAHENSDSKENLLTRTMQLGIAFIQSSKAEKWKQIAEAVRTPTAPPESTPTDSYY